MPIRFRSAIMMGALLLLLIVVLMLTPFPTYLRLGLHAVTYPDQTVFIGDSYSQISAVKHSNEADWDMIASKHPPLYWDVKPKNCTFDNKNDTIYAYTGIWIAEWTCHP